MENDYKVYAHIFPNGKRYVGITRQKLARRWRKGRSYSSNLRMTNAIKKYGWENIEHLVLFSGLSAAKAEETEKRLIAEWNLMDERYGYNYAEGGSHPNHSEKTKKKIGQKSLGRKHSEEFREWMRQRNSGINNYMYGKHHTDETKRKISEAKKGGTSVNKGKFGSNHPSAKGVVAVDSITGEDVRAFGSIIEAASFIGKYPSGIQGVLRGEQRTSGGYFWRRADG